MVKTFSFKIITNFSPPIIPATEKATQNIYFNNISQVEGNTNSIETTRDVYFFHVLPMQVFLSSSST